MTAWADYISLIWSNSGLQAAEKLPSMPSDRLFNGQRNRNTPCPGLSYAPNLFILESGLSYEEPTNANVIFLSRCRARRSDQPAGDGRRMSRTAARRSPIPTLHNLRLVDARTERRDSTPSRSEFDITSSPHISAVKGPFLPRPFKSRVLYTIFMPLNAVDKNHH